jgi:hypothetical protein
MMFDASTIHTLPRDDRLAKCSTGNASLTPVGSLSEAWEALRRKRLGAGGYTTSATAMAYSGDKGDSTRAGTRETTSMFTIVLLVGSPALI